jgi:hypothetical protein
LIGAAPLETSTKKVDTIKSQLHPDGSFDLDRLLKLRFLIARFGEMDQARWWNARGSLGHMRELALKRGFSKTHCRSALAHRGHKTTRKREVPCLSISA